MKPLSPLIAFFLYLSLTAVATNPDSLRIELQSSSSAADSLSLIFQLCEYYNVEKVRTDSILRYAQLAETITSQQTNDQQSLLTLFYKGAGSYKKDTADFFPILRQAIDLGREIKSYEWVGFAYYLIARRYRKLSMYSIAKNNFLEGIRWIQEAAELSPAKQSDYLAQFYCGVATNDRHNGDYTSALNFALEAKKHAELSKSDRRRHEAYLNFTGIYGDLSSPEKALGTPGDRQRYKKLTEEYMLKAHAISTKDSISRRLAVSSYNLAIFYALDSQYVRCDSFLDMAIAMGEATHFGGVLFNAYSCRSDLFLGQEKVDSALHYQKKSLRIAERHGSPYMKARALRSLSNIYLTHKDIPTAEGYVDASLAIAEDLENPVLLRTAYLQKYELEKAKGHPAAALDYFVKHQKIKDSLINTENIAKIEELKTRYETEKKEKNILALTNKNIIQNLKIEQQQQIIALGLVAGLLIISMLYFFFRQRSIIEQQKALNAQQKLLRTQLNPHFLFNTLNSIQQFIYQQEEPEKIADYLAKFSRLTRSILEHSKADYIRLEDEIDFLKDYIELQQIRFDVPFTFELKVADDIDPTEVYIPPMFTQPFIENSIEHGILNKREEGKISINFSKEAQQLVILLKDNGIGIERAVFEKKNKKHRSLATEITKERLLTIEKKLRKKTALFIQDLSKDNNFITGTQVTLKLPLIDLYD